MSSSSKASSSQSQTQTTTQTDNRIGASEGSIVAQGGSTVYGQGASHTSVVGDVMIQSIDADTVAAGLGLAGDVARDALDVVYGTSQEALFLAGDVTSNALAANSEVAGRAISETGAVADRAIVEANDTAREGFQFATDVTGQALDANRDTAEAAFLFGEMVAGGAGEIALAGIDSANRAVDALATSNTETLLYADRSQGLVSNAFERFGEELSKVKAIEVSGGQTERNKTVFATIAGVVILGVVALLTFFFRRKP